MKLDRPLLFSLFGAAARSDVFRAYTRSRLLNGIVMVAALCAGTPIAQASSFNCEAESLVQVERIKARVVLVGELHGTEQTPALVGRLICSLLRSGRPVVLALERDAAEQAAINQFMSSLGRPEDVRVLLDQGEWKAPIQDGRSSAATLALLDRLRHWREAGVTVPVVALRSMLQFNAGAVPEPKKLQVLLDHAMADAVNAALTSFPDHTVVVLAGEFHTAVGSKVHQDVTGGPSMGDVLADQQAVYVVGLSSSVGGTGWHWKMGEAKPGVHETMAGRLGLRDGRADFTFDLGPVSASLPARADSN